MNAYKWILKLTLGGLALSLMACSGVEFTPAQIEQSLSNPDPITPVDIDPVVPEDPPVGCPDPNGCNPNTKVEAESFYPNPLDSAPKVDILFVIDNSASMVEDQEKLGARLSSFVNSLSDVDWQIGITTTDVSNGTHGLKGDLVKMDGLNQVILNKYTPNYEQVFARTVVRPEGVNCGSNCPSVVERPLAAASLAIKKGIFNGFVRQNSELAIVILSDADEGGNGTGNIMTAPMLLAETALIFNQTKRITGFALVIEPGDTTCLAQQKLSSKNSFYGQHASMLAALTGGVTGSICDSNYAQSLQKIGDRVLNVVSSIKLSKTPIEETLKVTLSPADPSVTWTVEGKIIEFNKPPQPGTRVDVEYIAID